MNNEVQHTESGTSPPEAIERARWAPIISACLEAAMRPQQRHDEASA